MTKLKFIIGILFVMAFIALTFFVSGNSLALIIDIASFVISILFSYILISLVYSPREQTEMVGAILSSEKSEHQILERSIAYLKSLKNLIVLTGLLGTMLGTIGILTHLEDPNALGPNFSVALITLLYAVIYVIMVIEPLKASAEKKLKS